MLMTKQQRYILDVLDKLGCLWREQLIALLRARFCAERPDSAERLTDAMLRQLKVGNAPVRMENGVVSRPGARASLRHLEAIDVMLELSEGAPLDFLAARDPPVILRFSTEGRRISLFAVLMADAFASPLAVMQPFDPTERLIFLQTGGEHPASIAVPNKCFLAVRQESGAHRFYEINSNLEGG